MAAVAFKKPQRSVEARKYQRKQATLTGKIVCQGGVSMYNCTIRDISDTGARIGLSESHIVPNKFFLIDMRSRVVHESQVVWVAYAQRGVQFIQSFMIDHRLPQELEYLKRLWIASGAR